MKKIKTLSNEVFYIKIENILYIEQYTRFLFDREEVSFHIYTNIGKTFEVDNIDNLIG